MELRQAEKKKGTLSLQSGAAAELSRFAAQAERLPIPGDNGNWQVWDVRAGRYVDSGKSWRGYTPRITAERELGGVRLTVANADGYHQQRLYDGQNGMTYIPSVENGVLSWRASGQPGTLVEPVTIIGPAGKSAFEQAVEGGYTGTEEEFSEALANAGADCAALEEELLRLKRVVNLLLDASTLDMFVLDTGILS